MLCNYGCNKEAIYYLKSVDKWCCSPYSSQCEKVKEKIQRTIQNLYNDKNSLYNKNKKEICLKRSKSLKTAWEDKSSKWYSKETKELQRNKHMKNRNRGLYDTKEYRLKLSNAHKKIWADPNSSYNSDKRSSKISITMKQLYKDEDYLSKLQRGLKAKPNRKEKKLEEIIFSICNNFIFSGDFSYWIEGRNPDFIDDKNKLIIELFGDYWHSKKITGLTKKEHQKERIDFFKKCGYKCLVIWESELNNIEHTINKINEFIRKE